MLDVTNNSTYDHNGDSEHRKVTSQKGQPIYVLPSSGIAFDDVFIGDPIQVLKSLESKELADSIWDRACRLMDEKPTGFTDDSIDEVTGVISLEGIGEIYIVQTYLGDGVAKVLDGELHPLQETTFGVDTGTVGIFKQTDLCNMGASNIILENLDLIKLENLTVFSYLGELGPEGDLFINYRTLGDDKDSSMTLRLP